MVETLTKEKHKTKSSYVTHDELNLLLKYLATKEDIANLKTDIANFRIDIITDISNLKI